MSIKSSETPTLGGLNDTLFLDPSPLGFAVLILLFI